MLAIERIQRGGLDAPVAPLERGVNVAEIRHTALLFRRVGGTGVSTNVKAIAERPSPDDACAPVMIRTISPM